MNKNASGKPSAVHVVDPWLPFIAQIHRRDLMIAIGSLIHIGDERQTLTEWRNVRPIAIAARKLARPFDRRGATRMKRPLAVCTMFQNEPEFLPIWLEYYGKQAGFDNCFLIDHGSDIFDKSAFRAQNLFHLARSPQDETQRILAISNLTEYLLNYYDTVVYTDIDEIIVPHPEIYAGLLDYCKKNTKDVVYTIGLNIQHRLDNEPPFDPGEGVLNQRQWVRFVSPMCKPLILRRRISWSKGFHSCDVSATCDEVYLFHLRNFDISVSLKRLSRSRAIERRTESDKLGAAHQRVDDEQAVQWMRAAANMPKIELERLHIDIDPLASFLEKTFDRETGRPRIDVTANELWRIPKCFHHAF